MSVQVSLENTSNLGRKLTISVEKDKVDGAVKKRLQKLSKTIKIDGFRPGKVPPHVIKMRYGKAVREEVVQEVMRESLNDAFKEQELKPAGMPNVELTSSKEGEGIEFTAAFDVFPEIELADLSAIEVERLKGEVSDLDVEKTLTNLQKQRAEFVDADRACKDGDKVVMSFVGRVDGEEFDGGKAEDFQLELGAGNMIPGFEDDIVGMKAGDEKTIKVTFPEDYHAKDLAGKPAEFDISMSKVQEPKLPEIDDEFAKALGIESVAQLRTEVRNNLERDLNDYLKNKLKQDVMDKVAQVHELEVPETLIKEEAMALQKQAIQELQHMLQHGGNPQELLNSDSFKKENFEEDAKKRVKLGLLLSELIEKNEIKVDNERLKAKVIELSALYQDPSEAEEYFYGDKKRLAEIEGVVMEEQLVDIILEQAKVSEGTIAYSKAMEERNKK